MGNEDLAHIVSLCKEGNSEAQKELFLLYSKQMMFVCKRYLSTKEECNDAITDSFIKILESISSYKYINERSLYSWLKTIVVNHCINIVKKKKTDYKHMIFTDIEPYKGEMTEILEQDRKEEFDQEDLMKCLNRIPERLRLIFNMYVIEDFSYKEIALRLEIKQDHVKTYLSRARVLLKEELYKTKMIKQRNQEE